MRNPGRGRLARPFTARRVEGKRRSGGPRSATHPRSAGLRLAPSFPSLRGRIAGQRPARGHIKRAMLDIAGTRGRPFVKMHGLGNDFVVLDARTVALELSDAQVRSEEHTSELQSLMRNPYAVFCLTKKTFNMSEGQQL